MEQQQILTATRDRLGRNLHDGAIQTVYTGGLLVELARHPVADDSAAAPRLDKALPVNQVSAGLEREDTLRQNGSVEPTLLLRSVR